MKMKMKMKMKTRGDCLPPLATADKVTLWRVLRVLRTFWSLARYTPFGQLNEEGAPLSLHALHPYAASM